MTPSELEQALLDPQGAFGEPEAILARDDLSLAQKRQLLERWDEDARRLSESADEGMGDGEPALLDRVSEALRALGEG